LFGLFESPSRPGELIGTGEILRNPSLGDALVHLVHSGEELLYRGDWAAQLATDSAEHGGHLTLADLAAFRVELRDPLRFTHRGAHCLINPPPSPGGCLIAFVLALLSEWLPRNDSREGGWGEPGHVRALVRAFRVASLLREEEGEHLLGQEDAVGRILGTENLARWRNEVQWHSLFSRGTTHISVADRAGNVASLTASNGEGNTYVLPGTGIILNNMLGEEDLNPGGFHRWTENSRLASMMSPMIAQCADGSLLAMGSGGSNRIRSAICQVVVNILDFGLPLADAVNAPRLHLERELLSIEPGFGEAVLRELDASVPSVHEWPARNLFFGGVHSVRFSVDGRFEGAGDLRRDGAVAIA
jgi:gamma-glutamyltranspeptidase/glutathione hydrolase